MTKSFSGLIASALAMTVLSTAAFAAAPKMAQGKMASGKKVMLYQAAICHMYFTPAQAKKYHYACPDSHGKMSKVQVDPALAKTELAKTSKALSGTGKKKA